MDQVLSQEEIDALLNAMNTGEISEDTIEEEKTMRLKSENTTSDAQRAFQKNISIPCT